MSKTVVGLLRWIVALALPVFLVLTAARLLIADWFPRYEYAKSDFPRDRYGWTQQQRLDLALPSIHFLNSPLPAEQAISILRDQRQPGTNASLFTLEELSHMMDVKRVVDSLWRVHLVSGLALFLGLAVLVPRGVTRRSAYLALNVGGLLTAGLLLVLALFVVVGFDMFFTMFHEVFFPQGNWTFDYSDSLIRLFPEKLWFDAGFIITGGTLLSGAVVAALGWLLWRCSAPPTQAGEPQPAELARSSKTE